MNRRNFLELAASIPTFSVLMPRATRIVDPYPCIRITLLNPDAQEIEGATTTATRQDFELVPNGPWDYGENYTNCRDIKFPKPEYDWGEIHGFKVSDMDGKLICKTRITMIQFVRKGYPCSFQTEHFGLFLPE